MREDNTKKEIFELLAENSYGLTIGEVANALETSRSTASKYLAVMEAEGKILVREVGKAKLHYQKNEALEVLIR